MKSRINLTFRQKVVEQNARSIEKLIIDSLQPERGL
jgi:hypothetical protein